MAISHWSFSNQSRFRHFLQIAAPFSVLSMLTILLDKCQTKSFKDEHFNQNISQVLYHQSTFVNGEQSKSFHVGVVLQQE